MTREIVAAVLPPPPRTLTADSIFGPVDVAWEYIERLADALGWTEEGLVNEARMWVDYLIAIEYEDPDEEAHRWVTDAQWRAFWDCYEIVTGCPVPEAATHVDRDDLPFQLLESDSCGC